MPKNLWLVALALVLLLPAVAIPEAPPQRSALDLDVRLFGIDQSIFILQSKINNLDLEILGIEELRLQMSRDHDDLTNNQSLQRQKLDTLREDVDTLQEQISLSRAYPTNRPKKK
jgi:hypothetical protein